jgi:hypothetical protein
MRSRARKVRHCGGPRAGKRFRETYGGHRWERGAASFEGSLNRLGELIGSK